MCVFATPLPTPGIRPLETRLENGSRSYHFGTFLFLTRMPTRGQMMNKLVDRLWLTTEQTATQLGLAARTLANWRAAGQGPPFVKVGRRVRYSQSALNRFMSDATADMTIEEREV